MWITHIVFIDGIRDSQLQQVLRMAWHHNCSDTLVHACLLYTSILAVNNVMPKLNVQSYYIYYSFQFIDIYMNLLRGSTAHEHQFI